MVELASILFLGIGAQWLAWRLRLPSILVLLLVGFAAGPFSGLVRPDELLGTSLLPFVSLAVAAILLEGGLSLRLRELRGIGKATLNLILIGAPITFVLASGAAWLTLGVEPATALLFGSILVVTGPTVILPLLRHVRPAGAVGTVVRWEGIVTDPFGAILAVLVFQAIAAGGLASHGGGAVAGLFTSLLLGTVFGALGAGLYLALHRFNLLPDFLQSNAALAIGLGVFVASNRFQHESGLLAVTLMGVGLANQRWVSLEHVVEFKENLRVLLISSLFVLLAARVPREEFTSFDVRTAFFLALLVLVVRPAAVLLSTLGTKLSWRERAFVAWMAPRGIVAAAVASVFALELRRVGHPDAHRILPVVFAVIVVTVAVYGLTAGPLARWLGLARSRPQGVLVLGAHDWARKMAKALQEAEIRVLLVDRNHRDVLQARIEGLDAYYGNVFSEDFEMHAPLHEMGYMLCLTPNDEVNALACLHFSQEFERASLFQIAPARMDAVREGEILPQHLRGRVLFDEDVDFWVMQRRLRQGAVLKRTRMGEEFGLDDFRARYDREGAPAIPLFLIDADGRLSVVAAGMEVDPEPGDSLIALVDRESEAVPAERPSRAPLPG